MIAPLLIHPKSPIYVEVGIPNGKFITMDRRFFLTVEFKQSPFRGNETPESLFSSMCAFPITPKMHTCGMLGSQLITYFTILSNNREIGYHGFIIRTTKITTHNKKESSAS
jgi:hypothetical protein